MTLEPRPDPHALKVSKEEFIARFERKFIDPIYDGHRGEIQALANLAWKAHEDNHKAPFTRKAGKGYKDPDYDLSVEWIHAREAILSAQAQHEDPSGPTRILLISGANRNDQSCPGEISKSKRLVEEAVEVLRSQGATVEVLDLSRITSEYGKNIYPCKGCVSTAMPLCHWPCSCYPNYAVDQTGDWMNEIYPMWVRAHGVMIITPVYWNQAPSALKLMIDRMVCADGGNPDPTSTQGKKAKLAKELELDDWDYPRHLEGRVYSVFVHADTEGADLVGAALSNWLSDMNLIPASHRPSVNRYIGYYGPYALSHVELDKDHAVRLEVRQLAETLLGSAKAQRQERLSSLLPDLEEPRPK